MCSVGFTELAYGLGSVNCLVVVEITVLTLGGLKALRRSAGDESILNQAMIQLNVIGK